MGYYFIQNDGQKDFITHEENEASYIFNFCNELYITDNVEWANRVGANETTKEAAQEYVDAVTFGQVYGEESSTPGEPVILIVP
jgi:hypothetical protein